MRRNADADSAPVVVHSKVGLQIGDAEAVERFYETRLKAVQQTACKELAKAFVKIIAPKKQARNPYTGGLDTAPDWWPKRCGPAGKDEVRHREPDHLFKPGTFTQMGGMRDGGLTPKGVLSDLRKQSASRS
jgi:hypothetical protein